MWWVVTKVLQCILFFKVGGSVFSAVLLVAGRMNLHFVLDDIGVRLMMSDNFTWRQLRRLCID